MHTGGNPVLNPVDTAAFKFGIPTDQIKRAFVEITRNNSQHFVYGYAPRFLSEMEVPMPRVPQELAGDVLHGEVISDLHYSFVINEGRGMSFFVAYNVDRERLVTIKRNQTRSTFLFDPKVRKSIQNGNELYLANPFDRENIVRPKAVAWGTEDEAQLAYNSAFYYSVVCPQLDRFNQSMIGSNSKNMS